jgi:hypothetical protein
MLWMKADGIIQQDIYIYRVRSKRNTKDVLKAES